MTPFPSPNRRTQLGLSRTEVLLLSLVILVAIGVALPLYFKSQTDHARQTSANNLRQWGIAFNLYLADSDNALPRAGSSSEIATKDNTWFNALPPYLSQPMLKDLPANPTKNQLALWVNPAAQKITASGDQRVFNYGMNNWLSSPQQPIYRIYEIENPMAVVFLAEVEGYEPIVTPETVTARHLDRNPTSPQAATHFLFCDGHVELLRRGTYTSDPQSLDIAAPSERFTWIPYANAPAP